MSPPPPLRFLILDACVLIDYCDANKTVLQKISLHIAQIHIAAPVLREVEGLDERGAAALGICIVEPSLDLLQVAATKKGGLSFQDHLSLLLAKERGWICVSNDRALRTACARENVPVFWGLEMMGHAVSADVLSTDDAEKVAWRIHQENRYITKDVVEAFIAKFLAPRRDHPRRV